MPTGIPKKTRKKRTPKEVKPLITRDNVTVVETVTPPQFDTPPPPPVYPDEPAEPIIPERAYASIENYNPEARCQYELVYPDKIRARWVAKTDSRIEHHKLMGYWMARPKIDVKWHTGVVHVDGSITDVDCVLMCCPLDEHERRLEAKRAQTRSKEKNRQAVLRQEAGYESKPGEDYREHKSAGSSRIMRETNV